MMIALLFVLNCANATVKLTDLKVPPGFHVSLYAYPVPGARSLTAGPDGYVFVGSQEGESVYALKPNGKTAEVIAIGKGLKDPNGVAFKDGDLYVAEVAQVWRFKNILSALKNPPKPERFGPEFPSKKWHGAKFIAFGPDGWLYVPVGVPCNVCEVSLDEFGILTRISPDGSKREVIARGLRNSVGFDWSPTTKLILFTDNGRDEMGDDVPADELNRLNKVGENFGFPFCHAGGVMDPEFGKGKTCAGVTLPVYEFAAHSANLGMRFTTKNPKLKNSILVAQHGSWNRSTKVGYQVMQLQLDASGNKVAKAEPFLSGFLKDGSVSGRPVDVLELNDGSILVSDDMNGAVYRISN
jgi:glucose/arabinose dehydrogenase